MKDTVMSCVESLCSCHAVVDQVYRPTLAQGGELVSVRTAGPNRKP